MRATLALVLSILAILAAAFAAGYLALSFQKTPRLRDPDFSEVNRLRHAFLTQSRPQALLDPGATASDAELTAPEAARVLQDPRSLAPATTRFPHAEISELYLFAHDCDPRHEKARKSPELAKAWAWHRFGCGKTRALPDGFFARAPWIHPSGSSYVYMAWRSGLFGHSPEERRAWLQAHLPWLHVGEYAKITDEPGLFTGARATVAELDRAALYALASSSPMVLGKSKVLFRRQLAADSAEATYAVYERSDFERFLAQSELRLRPYARGESCPFQEGNACWSINLDRAFRSARTPTLVLLALTVALAIGMSFALLRGFRRQQLEERRKRFALQTLTHELRTPVAGLVLSAETLRKHFDSLGSDGQDALLRVFDDVQRLRRLTEASRQYLSALDRGLIALNPAELPDLGAFLEEAAEKYRSDGHDVRCENSDQAVGASVDPHWLSICVRNLIDNALAHGKPPVLIRLARDGERVSIAISDSGKGAVGGLDEMSRPFYRGGRSQGLGLGLSLVKEITREMGGRLEFEPNPTRFTIVIPARPSERKSI